MAVAVNDGDLMIRPVTSEDVDGLVHLWTKCGLTRPYNPPHDDIAMARSAADAEVLVGCDAEGVVASVMVGHDGHRGWMYYLAVAPEKQGQGLGRRMVEAAEAWLRERGIRKAQLLVRETNTGVVSFYERIGYEQSPVVVMQRWLDGTVS